MRCFTTLEVWALTKRRPERGCLSVNPGCEFAVSANMRLGHVFVCYQIAGGIYLELC